MSGLDRLLCGVPTIVVISCGERAAEIELRGVRGIVQSGELGLCIGIEITGTASAPQCESIARWLPGATLLLAASRSTTDFSLSCEGSQWLLWRWYALPYPGSPANQAREMSRQLDGQIALRGYLLRLLQRESRAPYPSSNVVPPE